MHSLFMVVTFSTLTFYYFGSWVFETAPNRTHKICATQCILKFYPVSISDWHTVYLRTYQSSSLTSRLFYPVIFLAHGSIKQGGTELE